MILLCLLLLVLAFHGVQAESQLGFVYNDVASCSSSAVTVDSLSFNCDTTTGCVIGDEVNIKGELTTTIPFTNQMYLQVKACKFWGYMCTTPLLEDSVNLCGFFTNLNNDGVVATDDDTYCDPAGTYSFDETFTLPAWSLGNSFAVNGVTFSIYVTVNTEFSCHAQFTTVRSDSTYTASAFLPVGLLVIVMLSGLYAYQVKRTRQAVHQNMRPSREDDRNYPNDHYITL